MAATTVVSVSMGVMKPVLSKLAKLMGDEYKKIKGLQKEVAFLQRELGDMDALLEKMDSADELDPQAKKWRRDLIEMSYNIEDRIDDFMHTVGEVDDKMGILRKASHYVKTFKDHRRLANEFQEIKTLVTEASDRRKRYMLDQCISVTTPVVVDPRMSALYKESASLVGIESQKDELVGWAMDEVKHLKFMAIVGFGGIGKTTLANEVYREVGGNFECKAFISVSQKPQMIGLFNSLLSQLGHQTYSHTCQLQDPINNLRGHLQNKTYFIIVDDLWGMQAWDAIHCAFPPSTHCSRVIITTRNEDVARSCCHNDHGCIHNMKQLSEQDSRKLFFDRIFGSEDACPTELKKASCEILKKCGGLPLAIITMASMLACQTRRLKGQWEYFQNSLDIKSATNSKYEDMMYILDLSYKNLPRHLKACFLYLGSYPEDHKIRRDELVRRWVAEGFVSKSTRQDVWDVAESYFSELVNRSMIQPIYDYYNFKVELTSNCTYLPSTGAAGGILLAASERFFKLVPIQNTEHTVSARITMLAENISWCLTGVYGPQADQEKIAFMQEISDLKNQMDERWLILGDFNLIYRMEDKNNQRINLPMLNRFKNTIDNLQLVPLQLHGRRFTWCNDQQNPTMTKIDHFLATVEWLEIFPRTDLQALASMGSDHCPLFLQGDTAIDFYRGFRFEANWVNMPGFMDTVKVAWEQPVNTQNALLRLHVKLLRTARALKIWRRYIFSEWKLKSAIIQIILLELEKAQERRMLTSDEYEFKRYLKAKAVGVAVVDRARAKQHSRLRWIKEGDANTRLFHIYANARRKKAFIGALHTAGGVATSQQDKMKVAADFFSQAVGTNSPRPYSLNWTALGYTPFNLEDLDVPFTEQEVLGIIKSLPSEKAPGPDGFIGIFYKKCWELIKDDLVQAVMGFYNHKTSKMHLFNESNIVLLPKKQEPTTMADYRPISLINSITKIITKLLATRLAPHMNKLVSQAQNAFIKKRCIHANFLYVQRVIQLLHKKKQHALFIKLDISKAFDCVGWQYLLEVLIALGFSTKWCNWISAIMGTSSSRVLVNGRPTKNIKHAKGLRQGDPLSPLLFIIAIDPLQKIIEQAARQGLLQPILPSKAQLRCSLYADDAALFAHPSSTEISRLQKILLFFGECSGLKVNMNKTEIFPIRMQANLVNNVVCNFPGKISSFPGKYLGLPLHTRKLRKIEIQPLIDKIGARLPGWKGKFLSSAGRETLVKTVLSSLPIYHLTVFQAQKWLIKKIDRIRRSFLWRGETPERTSGGHSLVNWPTTCLPKDKGGLGILDLDRFTRALRLRWLWYQWKQKN